MVNLRLKKHSCDFSVSSQSAITVRPFSRGEMINYLQVDAVASGEWNYVVNFAVLQYPVLFTSAELKFFNISIDKYV